MLQNIFSYISKRGYILNVCVSIVMHIVCLCAMGSVWWFPDENDVLFVFASSCLTYLRYLCLLAYSGAQHNMQYYYGFSS